MFVNKINIYNVNEELWSQYLIYFMGFDMVKLLSELCFPAKSEDKTHQQLIDLIENQLDLTQSKISETYKFRNRKQLKSESISEYVSALKKIAVICNFGFHLEMALRKKFVRGLSSESIIKRSFNEEMLTFTRAVLQFCRLKQ